MAGDPTPALTGRRRTRPTSIGCCNPWQPKPGRAPLTAAQAAVQTNRATSLHLSSLFKNPEPALGSHRSGATLSWVARFIYMLFTGPPEIPRPAPSRQFFASSIREHEFSPTGSLKGRNHPPDRSARAYGTEMAADLYQRRTLRMSLATCYRQKYLPLRTSDTPDIFYRNISSLSEPKF